MKIPGRIRDAPDKWLGITPVVIACALPLWGTQLQYGALQMVLGYGALLYWPCLLGWLILVVTAIYRQRWWWLLITAPFVLYPAIGLTGMIGNCCL